MCGKAEQVLSLQEVRLRTYPHALSYEQWVATSSNKGQSVNRANIPQMLANTVAHARDRCQKEQTIVRTVKKFALGFESPVTRLQVIRTQFIHMNAWYLYCCLWLMTFEQHDKTRSKIKKAKAIWDREAGKKQSWLWLKRNQEHLN